MTKNVKDTKLAASTNKENKPIIPASNANTVQAMPTRYSLLASGFISVARSQNEIRIIESKPIINKFASRVNLGLTSTSMITQTV